jgi:hypothetical protein
MYKIEESPYSNGWKQGKRAMLKLLKENKIVKLKSKISQLNSQEGKQMDNETIQELISLRKKGLLTEQELFNKLSGVQLAEIQAKKFVKSHHKKIELEQQEHPKLWRNHKAWTSVEDEKLTKMKSRQYSFRSIAKVLGRKTKACKMRYTSLIESGRVTPKTKVAHNGRGRTWTQSEADALIKNYGKMSDEVIAKSLNRTTTAIMHKASKLGLTNTNPKHVGRPKKIHASDTVQVGEFGFPKKFTVNP